ncbi:MAG: tRNA1(Val) (adenine(37)-N6)-methyltransferase [Brockia lithotrophica]|nr:tRNA1(Val) (adenine(37)-N6)-methyltransferase [Brockia lithotrophica]
MTGVEVPLLPGERVDRLGQTNLRIIQHPKRYAYAVDAVLLAAFARPEPGTRVVDLCSGNGAVALFLLARMGGEIDAVEISPELADMARRSAKLNGLEGRLHVYTGDVREVFRVLGAGRYDYLTCNPPYLPPHALPDNPFRALTHHEVALSFDAAAQAAARLLKEGGRAAFVHRADRLTTVLAALRAARLEPKRLRLVHARAESPAELFLVEAKKGAGEGLTVLPPLVLFDDRGRTHPEMRRIYERLEMER